ncbi:DNL zinc finger-domain-containing protein [Zopfochytrium polystomum]|nr:DNL zinc finger-domain-containing protein [Zopfochytrium polystomum]
MSKRAYETGVVIVQCDGCKSRHLIADHLGWFDTTQGKIGTIEDIMKRKAEEEANAAQQVVRVRNIGEMGLSQAEMDEINMKRQQNQNVKHL